MSFRPRSSMRRNSRGQVQGPWAAAPRSCLNSSKRSCLVRSRNWLMALLACLHGHLLAGGGDLLEGGMGIASRGEHGGAVPGGVAQGQLGQERHVQLPAEGLPAPFTENAVLLVGSRRAEVGHVFHPPDDLVLGV